MKHFALVFPLILMSVVLLTPMFGCQPPEVSPAPVTPPQPAIQPQTPQPMPPTQPQATVPPSPSPLPSQPPILQINVEIENGKHLIPVGLFYNIRYSTNQSAILTMSNALPDDTVITYITKEINVPGSVLYQTRADRPIGERVITLKAVGNDGQTAVATYKYWIGSVQGDLEKP